MNFSVIDPEGKVQGSVDATSAREACRLWAGKTSNDATVEEMVSKASYFNLGQDLQAARLEPYVLAPAGSEQEALRKNAELLTTDVHFRPEASLPESKVVDTGGGD